MSESRKACWYLENHLVALISAKIFPWSHQNLISQDPEKGDFMLSILALALFFSQELRCCRVQSCLEGTESWCCSKERLVELTKLSGKVRGLMCFQGLGFLWSFIFFLR